MITKFDLGRNQEQQALNRYNKIFSNTSYVLATKGKSNRYANDLINEALAICLSASSL